MSTRALGDAGLLAAGVHHLAVADVDAHVADRARRRRPGRRAAGPLAPPACPSPTGCGWSAAARCPRPGRRTGSGRSSRSCRARRRRTRRPCRPARARCRRRSARRRSARWPWNSRSRSRLGGRRGHRGQHDRQRGGAAGEQAGTEAAQGRLGAGGARPVGVQGGAGGPHGWRLSVPFVRRGRGHGTAHLGWGLGCGGSARSPGGPSTGHIAPGLRRYRSGATLDGRRPPGRLLHRK